MSAEKFIRQIIKERIEDNGDVPLSITVNSTFLSNLWDEGVLDWEVVTIDGKRRYWYQCIELIVD